MKWLSLMLVVVLGCSKVTTDKVEPSTKVTIETKVSSSKIDSTFIDWVIAKTNTDSIIWKYDYTCADNKFFYTDFTNTAGDLRLIFYPDDKHCRIEQIAVGGTRTISYRTADLGEAIDAYSSRERTRIDREIEQHNRAAQKHVSTLMEKVIDR